MSDCPINHLGIIMDGNGRWAVNQDQPRALGHKAGAQTAKKIINECVQKKIPFLTLYTFSNENWLRPKKEVDTLMELLSLMLDIVIDNMMRNNIRFNVVGRLEEIPKKTKEFLELTINKTKNNSGLFLTLAISYGGRQEIIDAMNSILESNIEIINEDILKNHLYCPELPDADLIIRTGGENRLSNFLLWQSAYAEIYTSKKLWPEFDISELDKALEDFKCRNRKFGKV